MPLSAENALVVYTVTGNLVRRYTFLIMIVVSATDHAPLRALPLDPVNLGPLSSGSQLLYFGCK
jgi:hypothetical protein